MKTDHWRKFVSGHTNMVIRFSATLHHWIHTIISGRWVRFIKQHTSVSQECTDCPLARHGQPDRHHLMNETPILLTSLLRLMGAIMIFFQVTKQRIASKEHILFCEFYSSAVGFNKPLTNWRDWTSPSKIVNAPNRAAYPSQMVWSKHFSPSFTVKFNIFWGVKITYMTS